ncbi:mitotic-spindle organizing protein 2-like isoform X2 [Ornithorhynchus anatinus]|uniref:mitotic-spindle organizing protein 2-like isoform X2 n=1 Tax=Ornithorhynchus anatinus TaxID=9258 RepID=UPI0010A859E6|nr:mitotic-spindle organizing protein 2-like isoform X2 [Ornithorhynchus anatinus]
MSGDVVPSAVLRAGGGGLTLSIPVFQMRSPRPGERILVDLLKLNVAPLAVFQMLRSMCAGQRLQPEGPRPEGAAPPGPPAAHPETRGRNRSGGVLGGSREGSGQRAPRQPSASRGPKVPVPGKSPTRSGS